MSKSNFVLTIIVLAQFCCTSLWFAGNSIIDDLAINFDLNQQAFGHLISAVQFGFIIGTLAFAILTIADRFSPSKVFFACALFGAFFNLVTLWEGNNLGTLLTLRFFIGFFLAGIYPVGMKIAADYFEKGLGRSLGFLVGALVLGTALPHLLSGWPGLLDWRSVIITTSGLALSGGISMLFLVPNGPFRKASQKVNLSTFFKVFKKSRFRTAAFGYFGHMWELYAFWSFVPFALSSYLNTHSGLEFDISIMSFVIIGIGGPACILGGFLSEWFGTKKIASSALMLSGICCLLSPWVFYQPNPYLLFVFLIFWGMVVIADSPLFSTLIAQNANTESKGTALTIVNCIGFSITITSIQLLNSIQSLVNPIWIFVLLAIGPVAGLIAMFHTHDEAQLDGPKT